jgi:hypothetical protein
VKPSKKQQRLIEKWQDAEIKTQEAYYVYCQTGLHKDFEAYRTIEQEAIDLLEKAYSCSK